MEEAKAKEVAKEIIGLYKSYGNEDYIGEPVSQIEHMCQCAQIAEKRNYDDEVIHMDDYGVVDHEKIGAAYLSERGFSEKITKLVASHVAAKRYLTFKNPEYYNRLSEASKHTLSFQGGRMSKEEADDFEKDEWFALYLALRSWDELAKEEHVPLPDLETYSLKIINHLTNN